MGYLVFTIEDDNNESPEYQGNPVISPPGPFTKDTAIVPVVHRDDPHIIALAGRYGFDYTTLHELGEVEEPIPE